MRDKVSNQPGSCHSNSHDLDCVKTVVTREIPTWSNKQREHFCRGWLQAGTYTTISCTRWPPVTGCVKLLTVYEETPLVSGQLFCKRKDKKKKRKPTQHMIQPSVQIGIT